MHRIFLLAVLLLGGCQHVTAPPPISEQILDLHTGQALTAQRLAERLATAPRVIVGEQHDNRDHHQLQLWLLQDLGERRTQGSLLLEMLTPSQQSRVDAVRQASPPPADMPAALAWQPGWDWNLYGPIVEFAVQQPYPLLAANLDDAEVRSTYATPPAWLGELAPELDAPAVLHRVVPALVQALLLFQSQGFAPFRRQFPPLSPSRGRRPWWRAGTAA